jgi:CBS domain-containing membrane protein
MTATDTPKLVRDLMRRDVKTLRRNDELTIADEVMRSERIRHLPVLDEDGALAGILSQRDLFHSALVKALGYGASAKAKMLKMVVVKEAMTTDVVTVAPDTTIADAAHLMVEKKIGCLPVVDGGRLVGIVTETDFVALAAR